jgi:gliding motility-associated-like protein
MEITVRPEPTLYVPNAFTPDGDGTNDFFMAKGKNIEEFQMLIFDRWGNIVFKTNSLTSGWDGIVNGEQAKEDVYVYKIQYKTNSNQVLTQEGHLSLLK